MSKSNRIIRIKIYANIHEKSLFLVTLAQAICKSIYESHNIDDATMPRLALHLQYLHTNRQGACGTKHVR